MRLNIALVIISILLCGAGLHAQNINIGNYSIREYGLNRDGSSVCLRMNINVAGIGVKDNEAFIIEPLLVKGGDTLNFISFGIYGKYRYYYYMRNNQSVQSGENDLKFYNRRTLDIISYSDFADYQQWMDGAVFMIRERIYGCCSKILSENIRVIGRCSANVPSAFNPKYIYVRPVAELVKTRSLSSSAYIDFPVSQTVIDEGYRDNRSELQKIVSTIRTVMYDKDIKVHSISLKGFASPEGSYSTNSRLASGRTIALKNYINSMFLSCLENRMITTESEPENWEGLREFVLGSYLSNREAIVEIIDRQIDPDKKEDIIKSLYSNDYNYLLRECYPALRKTDYTINYTIKSYTDINEIKKVLNEAYNKLSLEEFYVAAQEYELGSEEFNRVFRMAVKVYPNDEIANINAANAAMSSGNYDEAEGYLSKAGNSDSAIYARGILHALRGDYKGAKDCFTEVKDRLPDAKNALKQILHLFDNRLTN